jgi:hypothetical protein
MGSNVFYSELTDLNVNLLLTNRRTFIEISKIIMFDQ